MKQGKVNTFNELANVVMEEDKIKHDYIFDTNLMIMNSDGNLTMSNHDGDYIVTDHTHSQISTLTGIPKTYYDKMRTDCPELFAVNVNHWFTQGNSKRMLRTLENPGGAYTDLDGHRKNTGIVRAMLSPSYKRIDNPFILDALVPVFNEHSNLEIKSLDLTPNKLYVKAVNPRISTEVRKGDIVQTGILISNSEIGMGMVVVRPLIYRLVCLNGMIADIGVEGFRRRHVGRRDQNVIDVDYSILSDETVAADSKALALKIADVARNTLSDETFKQITETMERAADIPMTSNDIPKVVELMSKDYVLSNQERLNVQDALLRDSDYTMYGLANAITRASQKVESYDRATDLEGLGWKVMNTTVKQWRDWNVIEGVAV